MVLNRCVVNYILLPSYLLIYSSICSFNLWIPPWGNLKGAIKVRHIFLLLTCSIFIQWKKKRIIHHCRQIPYFIVTMGTFLPLFLQCQQKWKARCEIEESEQTLERVHTVVRSLDILSTCVLNIISNLWFCKLVYRCQQGLNLIYYERNYETFRFMIFEKKLLRSKKSLYCSQFWIVKHLKFQLFRNGP